MSFDIQKITNDICMTIIKEKSSKMLYFIPEWDDLVTKHYDFDHDKDLDKEKLYSHEIYPTPNYDGLLASRMKLEESKSKLNQMQKLGGVHKYFRFSGPIFGDCGAWGYYKEKDPPFETKELMDFYEAMKFDIGVSIDHLCVPGYESEFEYRKALTLKNAEQFYNRYQKKAYSFRPIGVAQGWDEKSYYESVKELLDIGFTYIALGGIARAKSTEIIKVLQVIQPELKKKSVKNQIQLHLFGVARLEAIRSFRNLGVTSFDSASPLRTAWLSSSKNYRDMNWNGYAAIRLPFLARDRKLKHLLTEGNYSVEELEEREEQLRSMLKLLDEDGSRSAQDVVEGFTNLYNEFVPSTPDRTKEYLRTLEAKPWKQCLCPICKEVGVEVIIFRGNNRNRRRGFHNTYVFYNLLKKLLEDENFTIKGELEEDQNEKTSDDENENINLLKHEKKGSKKQQILSLNASKDQKKKQGKKILDFI